MGWRAAELAHARGWDVHLYDAKAVLGHVARMLEDSAGAVLNDPRATLGPPWTRDHRQALAAAIAAPGYPPAAPGKGRKRCSR